MRYGCHTQTMLPGRENGGNLDTSAECVSRETSWIYISNGKLGLANYVFFSPRKPGCVSIVCRTKWKLRKKVQYLRAPSSTFLGLSPVKPTTLSRLQNSWLRRVPQTLPWPAPPVPT